MSRHRYIELNSHLTKLSSPVDGIMENMKEVAVAIAKEVCTMINSEYGETWALTEGELTKK